MKSEPNYEKYRNWNEELAILPPMKKWGPEASMLSSVKYLQSKYHQFLTWSDVSGEGTVPILWANITLKAEPKTSQEKKSTDEILY